MQKGDGLAAEQLLSLEWSEGAIRVLFLEDDDDFREALCWQLAERGFSVLGFADGDALLGALNVRSDADLVLLDWSLPSASGVESRSVPGPRPTFHGFRETSASRSRADTQSLRLVTRPGHQRHRPFVQLT